MILQIWNSYRYGESKRGEGVKISIMLISKLLDSHYISPSKSLLQLFSQIVLNFDYVKTVLVM